VRRIFSTGSGQRLADLLIDLMDGRAVRQGNANTIDPMRRAKATNHAQVVISKAYTRETNIPSTRRY